MKRRKKLSKKYSNKNFTRNAMRVNWMNRINIPLRGGIRL